MYEYFAVAIYFSLTACMPVYLPSASLSDCLLSSFYTASFARLPVYTCIPACVLACQPHSLTHSLTHSLNQSITHSLFLSIYVSVFVTSPIHRCHSSRFVLLPHTTRLILKPTSVSLKLIPCIVPGFIILLRLLSRSVYFRVAYFCLRRSSMLPV